LFDVTIAVMFVGVGNILCV